MYSIFIHTLYNAMLTFFHRSLEWIKTTEKAIISLLKENFAQELAKDDFTQRQICLSTYWCWVI